MSTPNIAVIGTGYIGAQHIEAIAENPRAQLHTLCTTPRSRNSAQEIMSRYGALQVTTDYEEVIADQEGVSRRLIDHCGLLWDEGFLDFHQNQRRVETASKWQVRQPIYRRSVDRWKNYEQFLGPLKQGLDWTQS